MSYNTIVLENDGNDWVGVSPQTEDIYLCHHGMINMFGLTLNKAERIRFKVTLKKHKHSKRFVLVREDGDTVWGLGKTYETAINVEYADIWLTRLFTDITWERFAEKKTVRCYYGTYTESVLPVWISMEIIK